MFSAWAAWGHMNCVLCCFLLRLGLRRTACQTTALRTWGFMGSCCSLGKQKKKKPPTSQFRFTLCLLPFSSALRKQADVIGHVGVGSGTMTHAWRISICFSILREFPFFLLCFFCSLYIYWQHMSAVVFDIYCLFYPQKNKHILYFKASPLCLLPF